MHAIANIVHCVVDVALRAQGKAGSTKLVDFLTVIDSQEMVSELSILSRKVEEIAINFPLPGLEP